MKISHCVWFCSAFIAGTHTESVAAPVTKKASKKVAASKTSPVYRTQTRDFLLYSVTKDGKSQPKMVLRADYLAYSGNSSWKQFLPATTPRTPENVLALYTKIKTAPQEFFGAFKTLYTLQDLLAAKKAKSEPDEDRFHDFFLRQRADTLIYPSLRLRHRYDVGDVSFLTGSAQPFPLDSFAVLRRDNRAYAANFPLTQRLGKVPAAIHLIDTQSARNVAPQSWPLPYRIQLRTKTGAKSNQHPLWWFFDGRPLDLPVEQAANDPNDAILNFTFQVVQTYRRGTDAQWLALWTNADANDFWSKAIHENPSYYKSEREQFDDKWGTFYIYFVMDLGQYASVFIATRQFLTLDLALTRLNFRKTADGYRLSSTWTMSDGEYSFPRYLDSLLNARELQSEIRRIVRLRVAPIATPSPL